MQHKNRWNLTILDEQSMRIFNTQIIKLTWIPVYVHFSWYVSWTKNLLKNFKSVCLDEIYWTRRFRIRYRSWQLHNNESNTVVNYVCYLRLLVQSWRCVKSRYPLYIDFKLSDIKLIETLAQSPFSSIKFSREVSPDENLRECLSIKAPATD